MNITKKFSAAFLALSLVLSSFCVYAAAIGTTPGYKLINTYSEETGTITADLYVTGGYGAVGQLGIYYDTDLLDLGATVSGTLTAEYDISTLGISSFVKGVTADDYKVTTTAETNKVPDLVDEENGEFFFAWYSGASSNVDARNEDKKIATFKFLVAEGVSAESLGDAGTDLIKFATEKPHNTAVRGYSAGVSVENEKTNAFRNSKTAKNRVTISVEFDGLDIDAMETVIIKVVDNNGDAVEGAYVKIGSKEYRTNAKGEVSIEVSGEYVVYYKYSESDSYEALEFGETTVELTAPSQPTGLTVTKGTEKLTVAWTKPSTTGGSDIVKYIISYTANGGSEQTAEVDGDTTRIVLEGLEGGTEYTVKVKAENAIGESEYSEAKKATPKSAGGTGGGGGGSSEVANYTVTYEAGTNGSITSGSKTEAVKSGSKPSKIPTIKAADGFEFIGWATKDGTAVDPKTVVIKAATTFYAQYKKLETPAAISFVDVKAGTYYEAPVQWAVNKGITTGTSATTFSPDSTCTRAQAVTFLWRAAGSPAPKNNEMVFTDVANGSYYYNAVLWAVENGITNGTSATTFSPDNNCTRAQIVTFLWRSQKTPAVDAANPFTDVASSQYYTNAVLWAVGNGITNGTSATTFSPDANCTRAQIVTFLYRCLADEK